MIWSTDPSKNAPPLPPQHKQNNNNNNNNKRKLHEKAVQSDLLWLDLNRIDEIGILQSADKQRNLSFHTHAPGSKRRYTRTQTASAVPK